MRQLLRAGRLVTVLTSWGRSWASRLRIRHAGYSAGVGWDLRHSSCWHSVWLSMQRLPQGLGLLCCDPGSMGL